jgi:hypothetical protein
VLRVIEAIHDEPSFGERVRMPSLPAWDVEDARSRGQCEHVHEARDLATVTLLGEDRLVFEQIVGVEVRLPPIGGRRLVEVI